jgi:hypothetical protein
MSRSTPVDIYCERTDPSFWAEPVNALTNIAFLLAAALAFCAWRRDGARDLHVLLRAALVPERNHGPPYSQSMPS